MKEDLYDDLYLEEKEEKTDFKAVLFKYTIHWPWFVACILLCMAGAWLYLRYTPPVYNISASVIIKDNDKNSKASSGMADLEDLGFYSSINNFDNEVEILQSRTLIKKVVEELDLYISYAAKSSFHDIELYKSSPVKVWITPEEAQKLPAPAYINLTLQPGNKLNVKITIGEQEYSKQFDKLPALLTTPSGTFSFTPADSTIAKSEQKIMAAVSSPRSVAGSYRGALSIEPTSKSTTIAQISVKSTHTQRGMDFINKLVEIYNRDANDDKNEVATKTAEFIDERINIINGELGTTEQELETFKRDAGLTDLKSDAQLALSENSEYEKKRAENSTQLRLVQFLAGYANNPDHAYEVLPVNVGLTDTGLTELINRYNEMLLERKRLLRSSQENNPVVVNLDASIRAMRSNVLTTINSVQRGLAITQADLERQAGKYAGRITNAPGQERQLVSISRQQEIKAGLYLMLLQKREENELSQAFTAYNTRLITAPRGSMFPTAPRKMNILLVAFAVGLLVPAVGIFMKENMNTKVRGRKDLENLSIPFIGEIPQYSGTKKKWWEFKHRKRQDMKIIVVNEGNRNIINEAFRVLRSNMDFMASKDNNQHVFVLTSFNPGSGKSFLAINIAISFAIKKKKILVIDGDLRHRTVSSYVDSPNKGLSDYLNNQIEDWKEIIVSYKGYTNLHILPIGTIPPNPTELLEDNKLSMLIEALRPEYDYIFIDCPPVDIVADAQIIEKWADRTIFVVRSGLLDRSMLSELENMYTGKRFKNLSMILNGTESTGGRYGYRYGYHYGYASYYGSKDK